MENIAFSDPATSKFSGALPRPWPDIEPGIMAFTSVWRPPAGIPV
jgi:hypothetical protein